jgi:predicted O-linked N-acetylglucosamine transferase (SPINDLY family)
MNPQLEAALQQAIQAFQGGNFDGAKSILNTVLKNDINSVDAIFELGINYTEENRLSESRIIFNCLESLNTGNPDISYGLGFVCAMQEDFECALKSFDKVIKLRPNDLDALVNYASTLHELKRFDEALIAYEKFLALKADDGVIFYNMGNTLHELKHYEEAIAHYDKALILRPGYAEAWSNKGITLNELKRFDEAIAHYDKALSLKPDHAKDWSNKGATLHELKRFDEAIHYHEKSLSLRPDYAEGWFNKGNTLNELKRFDEAITHFDKALSLKPDYHEAWNNKGTALSELKCYDEAIASFDTALSLKPDIDWLSGDFLHLKMRTCSWADFDNSVEVISKKVMANEKVVQPFCLLALNDNSSLHKQSSEIYVEDKYPENLALGSIPKASKKEKIRIGYFSADFIDHAVSILTAELFELHDKNRFEIIAISFGSDDKSPIRLRLSQAFNEFIDIGEISDLEIAKLSRDLEIDIAVDLGGHTAGGRVGIFSYRVAPIQLSYIGYLGTMGASYYDYLLADKTIIPDHLQQFYSEKIGYLPSYQVNDRKRAISDRKFTRAELGLPERGFIFCCFNNNYKILPSIFEGWMRILKAVDSSALFIYVENKWAKQNLQEAFEAEGINSARLVFASRIPKEENLARYRACDLFLDTFPYNAGTTASDALWAGVPVLTRIGQSFASRVAASLLNAIGLPELITNTQEEYEALAIELAMNPQKLADIKLKLANNRLTTPLFDTPLFAKNLEAAYLQMYERYQADLQPEHIEIT